MKKILFFILALAALITTVSAQNNDPVHFSFSSERKNDSLVYLVVRAKTGKDFLLFSAKPQRTDDPFISQLNLDSTSSKYLNDTSFMESSNVQTIKDQTTSTTFHGFTDSATFIYPLKIKNRDSAIVKGSFSWLGKKRR